LPHAPKAPTLVTHLGVGGVTLTVRAARPTVHIVPDRAMRPFLVRRGGDMELTFVERTPPEPDESKRLFDSDGVWRAYTHGRGYLYVFESDSLRPRRYKAVAIDRAFRTGALYFPPSEGVRRPRSALDFPLDELLFQHYFARHGALEVHACGVESDRRVLLFCGTSGAGKTTTALLWTKHRRGTPILSDDRLVLRLHAGRPWAYGTPWHGLGRFALPYGRPLAAVFFLAHGKQTRLERLSPAAAAARLFTRGFPPPWDKAALAKVLRTCERVVTRVPCYDFEFRPDRSAIEAALDAVRR
jgi:hypothetical protein